MNTNMFKCFTRRCPQNVISGTVKKFCFLLAVVMSITPLAGFAGEQRPLPFSPEWKIFLQTLSPVDFVQVPNELPHHDGTCTKPQIIQVPTNLSTEGSTILLDQLGSSWTQSDNAYLYNEFESSEDITYQAGAAADWWMEIYVNGRQVCSTMEKGNGSQIYAPHMHPFLLPVRKGHNVLAVKVLAGQQGWRFNWGTPVPRPKVQPLVASQELMPVDMSHVAIKPGSALDLSELVDVPAGKYGKVVISPTGLLTYEQRSGKPARFWGYNGLPQNVWRNVSDEEEFHRRAKEFALASRRQGYNLFRLHGLDEWIMLGSSQALQFDPKYLDRWDYLINEMKRQGCYFQLVIFSFNLYEPKNTREATFQKRRAHKLMLYAGRDWERNRFREAATKLLNHVNHYTGLAWKDDPAIAILEFYNEQYDGLATLTQICRDHPEEYKFFMGKWAAFLRRNYAKMPKSQWPSEIKKDGFAIPLPLTSGTSPELRNDFAQFCLALVKETNDFCTKAIRDAGYLGVVTQNSFPGLFHAAAQWESLPVVDGHSYFKHPSQWSAPGSVVGQESAVKTNAPYFRQLNSQRLYGRPFLCGEFNHCFWNPFQHELPLVFTAYAAFQNFSALSILCEPVWLKIEGPYLRANVFDVGRSPVQRAGELLSCMFFVRGDVKPARHNVVLAYPNRFLSRSGNAAQAVSAAQGKLALMTSFSLSFPELPPLAGLPITTKPDLTLLPVSGDAVSNNGWFTEVLDSQNDKQLLRDIVPSLKQHQILPSNNISNPAQGVFQTETGEITLRSSESLIKVVTPKTEAVSLLVGSSERLDALNVVGTSANALIGVTAVDNRPLREARRMVLVYATRMFNTGMAVESDGTLQDLGKAPALMSTGTLRIELENGQAEKMRCYALRLDGERIMELPLHRNGTRLSFTLDTATLGMKITPFFELSSL